MRFHEHRFRVAEHHPGFADEAPVVTHECDVVVLGELGDRAGLAHSAPCRHEHTVPLVGERGGVDHPGAALDHEPIEDRENRRQELTGSGNPDSVLELSDLDVGTEHRDCVVRIPQMIFEVRRLGHGCRCIVNGDLIAADFIDDEGAHHVAQVG